MIITVKQIKKIIKEELTNLLEDYESAIADISRLINLDPKNKKILLLRSSIYKKLSEIELKNSQN